MQLASADYNRNRCLLHLNAIYCLQRVLGLSLDQFQLFPSFSFLFLLVSSPYNALLSLNPKRKVLFLLLFLNYWSIFVVLSIFCVLEKMTIAIEQPQIASKENVDEGFLVPDANAFGNTFRDYNAETERRKTVGEFYKTNHIHQTYDFVTEMREKYGKLDRTEMSIWESIELLNSFVDESDPDLDEPQIEHLLQTAEAIRKDYPDEDWLHLTGLIHDLGKVLLHSSFGELPQWAVVGDTFPVGCAYDESNVHFKYFKENTDYNNPKYNTKFGVYSEGCGLENVLMSWGHDDYMYLVAKENKTTLPSAALFIIRYHSFYPLHKHGAYQYLLNEEDKENLKWLHVFNKYDLYSKSKVRIDVEKVKPYYLSLIEKYFPAKLKW
ncbi:putative inositol oxygenase [Canna indica]|uniref:Inositol oxygenase n=1 Tax=Canna indica TaxID=4628 RepID=A0AAQ3Q5N0_9LILI|nr:putative inositol oxygenase [Canna indica]